MQRILGCISISNTNIYVDWVLDTVNNSNNTFQNIAKTFNIHEDNDLDQAGKVRNIYITYGFIISTNKKISF